MPIYLPAGQEAIRTVDRGQEAVSIVEYRPAFVTGDVMRPGEVVYRPGMTARMDIAAVGDVGMAQAAAPGPDPIALRVRYSETWHAATAASARVWRLHSELDRDESCPRDVRPAPPGPGTSLDDILALETSMAETRDTEHRRQRVLLDQQIVQIDAQMQVLRDQLAEEKANEDLDVESLAEADKARAKGIVTNARLWDALISATRRLQTQASLMQLDRRQMELKHELDTLDDARRLTILDELQEARIVEGRERAALSGAEEGLKRARLLAPATGRDPDITVVRPGKPAETPIAVDAAMRPGDVVVVRLGSAAEAVLQSATAIPPRLASHAP